MLQKEVGDVHDDDADAVPVVPGVISSSCLCADC